MKAAMTRSVRIFTPGVLVLLALSMLFFWLWHGHYGGVDFNESGRHFDAEAGVVYTDSAWVWGIPAFGFLLLTVVNVIYRLVRLGRTAS
jgi:hypothetical protein